MLNFKITFSFILCFLISATIYAQQNSNIKNYAFKFSHDVNEVLQLDSTKILENMIINRTQYYHNYKSYDIVYLDTDNKILYIDQISFDMDTVDDLVTSQEPVVVKLNSIGPNSFHKIKFVLSRDKSINITNSDKVNFEDNDYLFTSTPVSTNNSMKKLSSSDPLDAALIDKLYKFQIYPARDPNNSTLDEFGNPFPMLNRGKNIKRVNIISSGFKFKTGFTGSNNTTALQEQTNYLSEVSGIINDLKAHSVIWSALEKNMVIYNLDIEQTDSDTSNDLDFGDVQTVLEDSVYARFKSYLKLSGSDYYISTYQKVNNVDIYPPANVRTAIKSIFGIDSFSDNGDYIILIANTRGVDVRAQVIGLGKDDIVPIYNASYPKVGSSIYTTAHEIGHLIFSLDDEYNGTVSGAPNNAQVQNLNTFTWGDFPWAPWINLPHDEIFNPNLSSSTYDTETVKAYKKPFSQNNDFSPCKSCLMKNTSTNGQSALCVICREETYNNIIGDVILSIEPKEAQWSSTTKTPNYSIDTSFPKVYISPSETIKFKVNGTDKYYKFANSSTTFYDYTWKRYFSSGASENITPSATTPNELDVSYSDYTQLNYKIQCTVTYKNASRIKTKVGDNLNSDFSLNRIIAWSVIKDNKMALKTDNIDIDLNTADSNSATFDLGLLGNISGAQFTIIDGFKRGVLDFSNLNALVYTINPNDNQLGTDSCQFEVVNSNNEKVTGMINILISTSNLTLFNKTIHIYPDLNGEYENTFYYTFVRGVDYHWPDSILGYLGFKITGTQEGIGLASSIAEPFTKNTISIHGNVSSFSVGETIIPIEVYYFSDTLNVTSTITINKHTEVKKKSEKIYLESDSFLDNIFTNFSSGLNTDVDVSLRFNMYYYGSILQTINFNDNNLNINGIGDKIILETGGQNIKPGINGGSIVFKNLILK